MEDVKERFQTQIKRIKISKVSILVLMEDVKELSCSDGVSL